MDHIKNNWVVGEVFHASDLNNIARTINALIDKQESLINDNEASDSSAFSSEKINEAVEERMTAVINDEEASGNTTYSSSKTEEKIEEAKLKTVVARELPLVGEENTIYSTLKASEGDGTEYEGSECRLLVKDGMVEIDIEFLGENHVEFSGFSVGDVFKYVESASTEYPVCVVSDIDKDVLSLELNMNTETGRLTDGILNGVTALTLQDGHYYKVKDELYLDEGNLKGSAGIYYQMVGYAIKQYLFEEVSNPSHVDYEDAPYIPGCSLVYPHTYLKYSIVGFPCYDRGDGDYRSDSSKIIDFPDLKIGQIVKVVGENNGERTYFVANEVHESLGNEEWSDAITRTSIWEKDEYYRFTGYHYYNKEGHGPLENVTMIETVATFEKIAGSEIADFELQAMPCLLYVTTAIFEKHMWIEDEKEFEYIGIA